VPGKAVVYLYRNRFDFVDDGASIMLDDRPVGTAYPGTYFRPVGEAPGRQAVLRCEQAGPR